MNRWLTTVLLLCVLSLRALVPGASGYVALCLGHDQRLDQGQGETHASHLEGARTCDHEADFPVILPGGIDHDRDCPCTDVELELVDILASTRHAPLDLHAAPPVVLPTVVLHTTTLGRETWATGASAGGEHRQRMLSITSTRLNI